MKRRVAWPWVENVLSASNHHTRITNTKSNHPSSGNDVLSIAEGVAATEGVAVHRPGVGCETQVGQCAVVAVTLQEPVQSGVIESEAHVVFAGARIEAIGVEPDCSCRVNVPVFAVAPADSMFLTLSTK